MLQQIAKKGMTKLRHHRMDGLIWKIKQRTRRTFNIRSVLSLLCLLLLSYCTSALCAPKNDKTNISSVNVQAALIKNFTHLIEWPKNTHKKDNATFNLCVHHSKKLEQQFKTIFTNKQIKGKPVNIFNVSNRSLNGCDLVYITTASKESISRVLTSAHQLGILTISAQDGYGQQGVHINFYESGQHMAFELNKHALDSAGFKVSTQLYHYARIVQ